MKVLVLGATGHIGRRLAQMLAMEDGIEVVRASRSQQAAGGHGVQVDTMDGTALARVLQGMDAVVNCVAGSAAAIAGGAKTLAQAAAATGSRIVHMSTMSVYGRAQGAVREDAPFDPGLGWYARAKCEAEAQMAAFVQQDGVPDVASWVVPHSVGPRFPGPLLIRTRCPDTSPNSTQIGRASCRERV